MLKKLLPTGMSFPYDFGFLPRREVGDGDAVDVLLLMAEPAFPGVVEARLIGAIQGEQTEARRRSATTGRGVGEP